MKNDCVYVSTYVVKILENSLNWKNSYDEFSQYIFSHVHIVPRISTTKCTLPYQMSTNTFSPTYNIHIDLYVS